MGWVGAEGRGEAEEEGFGELTEVKAAQIAGKMLVPDGFECRALAYCVEKVLVRSPTMQAMMISIIARIGFVVLAPHAARGYVVGDNDVIN